MKRSFSDSESEDGFGDDECGSLKPGSPSQSCHANSNRKKRRGIIEKRRRDRINQSLGELRRLVPAAFEKQGSAKLEKAEILQMTVDHLKMLNAKGLNGYNLDTAALAMDYRSVGFRECMSEVARYMVTMEGMDIQDPLRLRLTSHLQCYSTQRELASKAAAASGLQHGSHSTAWNLPSHPTFNAQCNTGSAAYGSLPPPHAPTSMLPQTGAGPHVTQPDHISSLSSSISPTTMKLPGGYQDTSRLHQGIGGASHGPSGISLPQPHSTNTNTLASSGGHHSGHMLSGLSQMTSQFPASLSSSSLLSPHYNSSAAQSSLAGLSQGGMKPHRPWGTELAF